MGDKYCLADHCQIKIPEHYFMCMRHWKMVPNGLKLRWRNAENYHSDPDLISISISVVRIKELKSLLAKYKAENEDLKNYIVELTGNR